MQQHVNLLNLQLRAPTSLNYFFWKKETSGIAFKEGTFLFTSCISENSVVVLSLVDLRGINGVHLWIKLRSIYSEFRKKVGLLVNSRNKF